jgi:ABC-type amino acid transport substrate-binding protein
MLTKLLPAVSLLLTAFIGTSFGGDLQEVKERGVLRHLGVPYANFVTGSGDGLDVEMVQLFAEHLGVRYEYVKTSWEDVIADISGKSVKHSGDRVEVLAKVPVKGDIVASGLTILPWRQKVVSYSYPTFPNQVWLIVRSDSRIQPITPSNDTQKDIDAVKALVKGITVLGISNTCVDPKLYKLEKSGCVAREFAGSLNELIPAILNGEAQATLLDIPDVLIALEKWPSQFKVIGPVSTVQEMGYAFANDAPQLRESFNRFFEQCQRDGTYLRLIKKYYPAILETYPEFFKHTQH